MSKDTECKCDDCGAVHKIDELDECRDFWSRVARPSPGSEMPAGDCPVCGAFSYIMKTEKDAAPELIEALIFVQKALAEWRDGKDETLHPIHGWVNLEEVKYLVVDSAIEKATGQ